MRQGGAEGDNKKKVDSDVCFAKARENSGDFFQHVHTCNLSCTNLANLSPRVVECAR
jgi:hypothetical protein